MQENKNSEYRDLDARREKLRNNESGVSTQDPFAAVSTQFSCVAFSAPAHTAAGFNDGRWTATVTCELTLPADCRTAPRIHHCQRSDEAVRRVSSAMLWTGA